MKCSNCNLNVAEHSKVLVVYQRPEGILFSWSCEHFPFDENDPSVIAVLASADCSVDWFVDWRLRVQAGACEHERTKAS